jgi:hypothetical protein
MLLVAGTAIGIALAGLWGRELAMELPTFKMAGWSTASRTRFAGYALASLLPASLTVLALRLRSPRPRIRLLLRQPGAIACLSSTLALFGQALALPLDLRTMGSLTSPLLVAAFYWPTAVAAVVTTSWLVLALSRRWRARGDWVDQLGMVVGVCWIGLLPALFVIEYLLG